MPSRRNVQLIAEAETVLGGPAVAVSKISADQSSRPGLYAFYASASTWKDLELGRPPDDRPLYVGKAERTLASRDIEGHFGLRERGVQSPTGSSTLRRSLASLLADAHGYCGMPRNPAKPGYFSNFGLSVEQDEQLSAWMRRRLRLVLWPHPDASKLDGIETEILQAFLPPLNLNKVTTPWRGQVKAARKVLASEARAWRP